MASRKLVHRAENMYRVRAPPGDDRCVRRDTGAASGDTRKPESPAGIARKADVSARCTAVNRLSDTSRRRTADGTLLLPVATARVSLVGIGTKIAMCVST